MKKILFLCVFITFQSFCASVDNDFAALKGVITFERQMRYLLNLLPNHENSQELKALLEKFKRQIWVLNNVQGGYQLEDGSSVERESLLREICDMWNSESLENSRRMSQFLKNAINAKTLSTQSEYLISFIKLQNYRHRPEKD